MSPSRSTLSRRSDPQSETEARRSIAQGLQCDPGRSTAPAPRRNQCRVSSCSRLTSRHRTQTASGIETIPQWASPLPRRGSRQLKHTVYELAKDTGSIQGRLQRVEAGFAGDFVLVEPPLEILLAATTDPSMMARPAHRRYDRNRHPGIWRVASSPGTGRRRHCRLTHSIFGGHVRASSAYRTSRRSPEGGLPQSWVSS